SPCWTLRASRCSRISIPSNDIARTLLFQQLGLSPAQILALGGGARQFSIDTGIPQLSTHQMDVGVFGGDEWNVRPNITLNMGFRYETQTNIHDSRDFAPRMAVASAPGGGR